MDTEFVDGGARHKEGEDKGIKGKEQDKSAEDRSRTSSPTTYVTLPIISCGVFLVSYTYTASNPPFVNYFSISSLVSRAISRVAYSI